MKFYKPSEEEMKTVDDIREENRQELLALKKKKRKIIFRLAYIFLFVTIFYLILKYELNLLDNYNSDINNTNNTEEIKLTGLELSVSKNIIEVGENVEINVKYKPNDVNDKKITWISNNESVATVDNGNVKGISPGEALITAKGSNNVSNVIMIYVK